MFTSKAGRVLMIVGFAAACAKDPVSVTQRGSNLSPDAASQAEREIQNDDGHGAAKIASRDDCDPTDPAWAPTGGCLLRTGNVTFAEFGRELNSTLSHTTVVGHPGWRNDPTYLVTRPGRGIRVRNEGGRTHTY